MTIRSFTAKVLSPLLACSIVASGCAAEGEDSSPKTVHRSALDFSLLTNTVDDYAFLGQPLEVSQYLALGDVSPEVAELETNPEQLFLMPWVDFGGDRVWERVQSNRFDLVGTNGNVSVQFSSDFKSIRIRKGDTKTPFQLAGSLQDRRAKAGLLLGMAMSGSQPTDEVMTWGAHVGGIALLALLLAGAMALGSQAMSDQACTRWLENCTAQATADCNGLGFATSPHVECGGSGSFGETATTSGVKSCSWECNTGGGGGNSGGGIVTGIDPDTQGGIVTATQGDGGGDEGDGGDGGDGGGGTGGGGGSGGAVNETDECTEVMNVSIYAGTMSADGSSDQIVFGAADEGGGGGC